MRKLLCLAMSAVVLGMAFTFNACGGNDANNPEPKRFKMTITKKSDTSVKVEIESPSKDLYSTFGCVESETFLKDPRGYIQSILDTYKETNEPTYPEGLHIEAERTYDGLDPETEYVIYVCEVNEDYQAVGNVEYTRIKRGKEVTTEDPQEPQVDPTAPIYCDPTTVGVPLRGGKTYTKLYYNSDWTYTVNKSWVTIQKEVHGPTTWGNKTLIYVDIIAEAGEEDEATVLFTNSEGSAKLIVKRTDSADPNYEYSDSPEAIEGTLSGKFSTDPYSAVYFSKGNLRHQVSTQTYRFADKQWETIGQDNKNIILDEYGERISNTYSGWIDLFWGSENRELRNEYFVDMGSYPISNGGNKADIWRTLNEEEWQYILLKRERADELVGLGSIDGVNGMIILPDNWTTPSGVTFKACGLNGWQKETGYWINMNSEYAFDYSANPYTSGEWSTLESKGAVFLPACGYSGLGWNPDKSVYELNVYENNVSGYYWVYWRDPNFVNSSLSGAAYSYIEFDQRQIALRRSSSEEDSRSVRLVRMARK